MHATLDSGAQFPGCVASHLKQRRQCPGMSMRMVGKSNTSEALLSKD